MLIVSLVFIATLLVHPGPQHAKPQTYWVGRTAGHKIRWTADQLSITPISGGVPLYKGISEEVHGDVEEGEPEIVRSDQELLSVVGPFVSIRETQYMLPGGGTGSSGSNYFRTLDLEHPGVDADLRNIFQEKDLLEALRADAVVRSALEVAGKTAKANTLQELLGRLDGVETDLATTFDQHLLQQFAFHHIEGDRVAIRVAVHGPTHGAMHSSLTQIGLLLPIPQKLRSALQSARLRKTGFLMIEQPALMHRRRAR